MKRYLRSLSLSIAFVAILTAGFAIGRWSSRPSTANGSKVAQSAHVQRDTIRLENSLVTPVPVEDGTGRTALDVNIATPDANTEGAQTFSFFMGFTR